MPELLTLSEWGGTPNGWPQMQLPAVQLWVHHSVTNETVGVPGSADAIADFRTLDTIGRSNGHGGISYSYAIHPDGIIGEGQGTRRGAHTAGNGCNGSPWGHNPCSFGVCFIGNYMEDSLTAEAVEAFHWLRDKLVADGLLVPGTYPTGGHRDAPGNFTACPGDNIESMLDVLRGEGDDMPTVDEIVKGMADYLNGDRPDYNAAGVANLRTLLNQLSGAFPGEGVPSIAEVLAAIDRIPGGGGGGSGPSEDQVKEWVREVLAEKEWR
jgi:hypothetical protein